jgi:pimeloyl-ACP methyl ester carboxylesterase
MRFDALVRYDLPQALAAVLERTGATRVDYVGFSMGGMLLYAALGRTVTEQQLRRVAFIGSPAVIRFPWKLAVTRWFGHLPRGLFPPLPLGLWSRLGAFAVEVVRTPLHRLLFNPANVAPGVARRALANIIENIPGGLNWDFAVWLASSDGRLTFDGVAVLNSLAGVRTPALFVAGAVDRLAPIEAVRVAYQSWGSEAGSIDKQLLVLGKNSGTKEDYGHGDLAVGRYAQTELFAAVAEFLAKPEPKPG